MTVRPTDMIIQRPFENAARSTAVGFISIQLQDADGKRLDNPFGFALCRLTGNYFQTIEIVELIDLRFERSRNINFILAWSERVQFSSCYIDEGEYVNFNGDQRWQQLARQRKLDMRYPALRPCARPDDPAYRQIESLSEPAKDGRLKAAKSLNLPSKFLETYRPGDSPRIDALAGAVEQIIKLQRGILASVAREQRELKELYG